MHIHACVYFCGQIYALVHFCSFVSMSQSRLESKPSPLPPLPTDHLIWLVQREKRFSHVF